MRMEAFMQNQLDYAAIGNRIREARIRKELTQEELANMTELSVPYISNIENNHTKVSLPTISLLANKLETSVDQLLYDNTTVLLDQYDADFKEVLRDCVVEERDFLLDTLISTKKILIERRVFRK